MKNIIKKLILFISIDIIEPLKKEINKIDNEIDKLVYELYELTDKEIKIIEKSFS